MLLVFLSAALLLLLPSLMGRAVFNLSMVCLNRGMVSTSPSADLVGCFDGLSTPWARQAPLSCRPLWQAHILTSPSYVCPASSVTKEGEIDVMAVWALRRGQVLVEQGDWRHAGAFFAEGAELGASSVQDRLYLRLGQAQYVQGKRKDNVASLKRALDLTQDPFVLARASYYLGQTYLNVDEPDRALEPLQFSSSLDPARLWDHYALGRAYEMEGQPERAYFEYLFALILDTEQSAIRDALKALTLPSPHENDE